MSHQEAAGQEPPQRVTSDRALRFTHHERRLEALEAIVEGLQGAIEDLVAERWGTHGHPKPGDVLVGFVERYDRGERVHGPVRTVVITDEDTGKTVIVWLQSIGLLNACAKLKPTRGERIALALRDESKGASRWRLAVDRRELDFSPLGGEADDERGPRAGLTPPGSHPRSLPPESSDSSRSN